MSDVQKGESLHRSRQTLVKGEIIEGRGTFSEIISRGKRIEETRIQGYLLPVDSKFNRGSPFRVGFAVSRRIKSAVERNRIRRLMREAYRKNKWILREIIHEKEEFYSLVLMYKGHEDSDVSKLKLKDLEADIQKLLRQALVAQ